MRDPGGVWISIFLFAGIPLLVLVYLLVTSDPDQATPRRLVAHLVVAAAGMCLLVAAVPDGGLLIGIAAAVFVTGATTSAFLARHLHQQRHERG